MKPPRPSFLIDDDDLFTEGPLKTVSTIETARATIFVRAGITARLLAPEQGYLRRVHEVGRARFPT